MDWMVYLEKDVNPYPKDIAATKLNTINKVHSTHAVASDLKILANPVLIPPRSNFKTKLAMMLNVEIQAPITKSVSFVVKFMTNDGVTPQP